MNTSGGRIPPARAVAALCGVFERPGLLAPESFPSGRIVADADLQKRASAFATQLAELRRAPTPLIEFLKLHPWHRRLGRYFETLLQYAFLHLAKCERFECNLQIRDGKRTLGELDLVFDERGGDGFVEGTRAGPQHWETSVKFYLCIAETPAEARQTRFYLGTLVEDRLDRKIEKLVGKQLDLARQPAAAARLESLGLSNPTSRALLKGFFYYPAWKDWQNHPCPPEVSSHHQRGWWTTTDRLDLIPRSADSHYVFLALEDWLEPLAGELEAHEIYTFSELCARIGRFFDSSWARPVNYEAMVAEVEIVGPFQVRERSRGNILHPKWPPHARASLGSS